VPAALRPAAPTVEAPKPEGTVQVDMSMRSLVEHWRVVIADLQLHYGVNLYDPAVLALPWPGIRSMIHSLLDSDTRLRRALTRR